MDESIAVPRENGELQFEAPWEARAFGLAVALNEGGAFPWTDFSQMLSAVIAGAEASGEPSDYYEQWVQALEQLAIEKGLVFQQEVDAKAAAVEAQNHHHH